MGPSLGWRRQCLKLETLGFPRVNLVVCLHNAILAHKVIPTSKIKGLEPSPFVLVSDPPA